MYLRTLNTQPISHIQNNFTLAELSSDTIQVNKLIDSKEETQTTHITSYEVSTTVKMGV